jgi:hypothetical protein
MFDTTLTRITVEFISAVFCIVLVKYMIKPYQLTKETRYLGLPVGFSLLGLSFVVSAVVYYLRQTEYFTDMLWFQSLMRTFAFLFLAITYYFSTKLSKNTQIFSGVTFGILSIALTSLFFMIFVTPTISHFYAESQIYVRVFNVLCLTYVAIHTLRSHIRKPDPTTIWIPLGFILLGISQYSLLFWYTDLSLSAFTGAMALRLAGLSVILVISYRTFYNEVLTDEYKV